MSALLPLLAGAGLVVGGLVVFAAGTEPAQEFGLSLVAAGAGIALLRPLLRSVRDLRGNRVWESSPAWIKAVSLVHPVGLGIGSALLVGFALFVFLAAATGH